MLSDVIFVCGNYSTNLSSYWCFELCEIIFGTLLYQNRKCKFTDSSILIFQVYQFQIYGTFASICTWNYHQLDYVIYGSL
jgi:hypothetical protein